jgi:uncharacterized cupredoxin-like copper-binding protein
MRIWIRSAGILAVVTLFATGCIDESDSKHEIDAGRSDSTAAAAQPSHATTNVKATLSEWTIALSQSSFPQGTVSFEITNSGTEEHAFEIGGTAEEWKTAPIKPGESATLTLVMTPGTYDVYCPLASGGEAHADRGMKVAITVK